MQIKNNKYGFSLVELVVVIAIIAVFAAILAPSLISYTEKSRASKDISAMDEVVNAVLLSTSDELVYDELIALSAHNNISCYVDAEYENVAEATITKKDNNGQALYYSYDSDCRLLDETPYFAAGKMRGVTITFGPEYSSNATHLPISKAIINKFTDAPTSILNCTHLYNSIRQSIGDSVNLSSQTYRNSEYTIFISIGSTGGNSGAAQNAIQVYGQFSGTNLSAIENQYEKAQVINVPTDVIEKTEEAVDDVRDYLEENGDEIKENVEQTVDEIVEKTEDYVEENEDEIVDTAETIKDKIGGWWNKVNPFG